MKYNDFREVCAAMQRWGIKQPFKAILDAVPGPREVTADYIVRKTKAHVNDVLGTYDLNKGSDTDKRIREWLDQLSEAVQRFGGG